MLESKNCKPGQEQYELYNSKTTNNLCLQYDYRNSRRKLFSTVITAKNEDEPLDDILRRARIKRDNWAIENGL